MKRVCHMTSAHNSDDVRIFHKECTSLAKAGYDVWLVARGGSRDENGVHVLGVGQPSGGRLSRMTGFARRVYDTALTLDADIYHLHDPELLPYALKLKRHGKKVIFDSHEDTLNQMSQKQWIPVVIRPFVSVAYRRYAENVFRRLDALISVTPHVVEELRQINPHTWMVTNYPKLDEQILVKDKRPEKFTLCFTGGIDEQWCHAEIIAAINAVDRVRYVLCGFGAPGYLAELQGLPGWDKADYRGKVPHEEAVRLQRQSDAGMALLKPSNNSGRMRGTLGNTKIFEYMMSGLPVICTDFALWQDIIDRYQCGLCIDPTRADEIIGAIKRLEDDPQEARRMGQNGRRAVEQEFNWGTQEAKLLELYEDISRKREVRPC